METTTNKKGKDVGLAWFRIAYAAFVLLSVYYAVFNKDMSSAVANLGIALVFDPFDQKVAWNLRPRWQRAWLIVHLSILITGFIMMISGYRL